MALITVIRDKICNNYYYKCEQMKAKWSSIMINLYFDYKCHRKARRVIGADSKGRKYFMDLEIELELSKYPLPDYLPGRCNQSVFITSNVSSFIKFSS
jgi:hypothetical protein